MAKLYEITSALAELESLVDSPDMTEEQIAQYLDTCKGMLKEKVTDIGMFVQNLESTADAIAKAEKQMAERRKAIENRVKSIKAYVLRSMQAADVFTVECEYFKIARQKNPPLVVIDDEKAISIEYWRQPETPPPAIDKKLILDHIKSGVIIDGVHTEQSERLVIK